MGRRDLGTSAGGCAGNHPGGPWEAVLVMTSVVTVQALIFQDGGCWRWARYLQYGRDRCGGIIRRLLPGHKVIRKGKWATGFKGFWLVVLDLHCRVAAALELPSPAPLRPTLRCRPWAASIPDRHRRMVDHLRGFNDGDYTKKSCWTSPGYPAPSTVPFSSEDCAGLLLALLFPAGSANPVGWKGG